METFVYYNGKLLTYFIYIYIYGICSKLCNKPFDDKFYTTFFSFFSHVDSLYALKWLPRRPQSKLSHSNKLANFTRRYTTTTCRGITFIRMKFHASFENPPSSVHPLIYPASCATYHVQATSEKRINNPATERPVSLVN